MSEKVLFVDDEANVLSSFERNFRHKFQIETAESGDAALKKIAAGNSFAVVISDRQMPAMDGIKLLTAVKERAPDTVRMMLTGNADLAGAIQAVNEGNIFRFLTKPCSPEVLSKAIEAGLTQYRLVTAEKELLNKTLNGSIKLMSDILSMVDPRSFGRAQSMKEILNRMAAKFKAENDWEIPLAAMLASIGNVTIPPDLLIRSRAGDNLSRVEQQVVSQLPETAARLLANIPRLEGVARIVKYQHKHFDGSGTPADSVKGPALPFGSRLLKILADLAQLQTGEMNLVQALNEMQARQGWYDPVLLEAVSEYHGVAGAGQGVARPNISISINDLRPGMILYSNIETNDDILILGAGQHITEMNLERIKNYALMTGVKEPLFVEAPNPIT